MQMPFSMAPQTYMSLLIALTGFSVIIADESSLVAADFIRLYGDSGNIVDFDNRALENPNLNGLGAPSTALVHKIETRSGNRQHYCGEILVHALALVCKGSYNKRNFQMAGNDIDYPYLSKGLEADAGYTNWPEFFEILKNAGAVPGKYHPSGQPMKLSTGGKGRTKRGIVDECCKRPCTHSTMQQYCKYPNN